MRARSRTWRAASALPVAGLLAGLVACKPASRTAPTEETPKALSVSYLAQTNDTLCQSTVLAMLLGFLKGQSASPEEIQRRLDGLGGYQQHHARERYLRGELPDWKVVYRYVTKADVAWREISARVAAGVPVVMSSKITPAGHVVLVIGVETNDQGERQLVVHDPRGRFDFAAHKMIVGDGRYVRYPLDAFYSRFRMVRVRLANGAVVQQRQNYFNGEERWIEFDSSVTVLEVPPRSAEVTEWQYLVLVKN